MFAVQVPEGKGVFVWQRFRRCGNHSESLIASARYQGRSVESRSVEGASRYHGRTWRAPSPSGLHK
jgi:hypothetical protein